MSPHASPQEGSPSLCVADDATFWPWYSSPVLGGWPNKENTVVVAPLAGMADWGLGHPMDSEETVLMEVVRRASIRMAPDRKPLVLPPLRFVVGPDASCVFAVDPPTAHAWIAEIAASVGAAGFRKIVLLNASPWNEEICAAAARDLRVSRGLHLFQIHLSALGLDFHPLRSQNRRNLQTLLTALYGQEPEAPLPGGTPNPPSWGTEPVRPLPAPAAGLEQARREAAAALDLASGRLSKLLSDIHDRAPLSAKINPV